MSTQSTLCEYSEYPSQAVIEGYNADSTKVFDTIFNSQAQYASVGLSGNALNLSGNAHGQSLGMGWAPQAGRMRQRQS